MDPTLDILCGPLLRYSSLIKSGNNVSWTGSILIVTNNHKSTYDPSPIVTCYCDTHDQTQNTPGSSTYSFKGEEILNFNNHTFWKFSLSIPVIRDHGDTCVQYSINNGPQFEFYLAGKKDGWQFAFYSCNGFSSNVNAEEFNGSDPLWKDMLLAHKVHHLHALVGGGDQIYCDRVTRESEPIKKWIELPTPKDRSEALFSQEMQNSLDLFYFRWYCDWFSRGAMAEAFACIPNIMLCDDHDLIDGFGSYPDDWMLSSVFQNIGSTAFKWYLLMQNHKPFIDTNQIIDYSNCKDPSDPCFILGATKPPYIPYRSHSILTSFGPRTIFLGLDGRGERKKNQMLSRETYGVIFKELRKKITLETKHIVVLIGVPIAYPRLTFLENMLEIERSPLLFIARHSGHSKKILNQFNGEVEIKDDLVDSLLHKEKKSERNWVIEQFQNLAIEKQVRVTFISGDVHCSSIGRFYTPQAKPITDPRFMMNIVSSAIVNSPPPAAVLTMVATRAENTTHKLEHIDTMEDMIPIFAHDPLGPSIGTHYHVHDPINQRPSLRTIPHSHLPHYLKSAFPNPKLLALAAMYATREDPENAEAQLRKANLKDVDKVRGVEQEHTQNEKGEPKLLKGPSRFVMGQRNYCLIREVNVTDNDDYAKNITETNLHDEKDKYNVSSVVDSKKRKHSNKFDTISSSRGDLNFTPQTRSNSDNNVGLEFVLRIERGRGKGETEGYSITAPALLGIDVKLGTE